MPWPPGSDGVEAVELARKHHPDLIVIDYAMPNMDGMEAAEQIIQEMSVPIVLAPAVPMTRLSNAPKKRTSMPIW